MKIRQKYTCGRDVVSIRFLYDSDGCICDLVEVDGDLEFEEGEFGVPNVEVTDQVFKKIINNSRLK